VKGIEDQIKAKEQKLKALGWDGGINKAILIDQLAASLPQEITWKAIEVNPVDVSGSRIQRLVMFKDGQIKVTGLSQQIIPVNEWMARVKILKWVKSVQLENFGLNQELNTGQFTINITY
jgi:Tfp pilus assembly protein PilN